jgi:hypothetical protein
MAVKFLLNSILSTKSLPDIHLSYAVMLAVLQDTVFLSYWVTYKTLLYCLRFCLASHVGTIIKAPLKWNLI